MEFLQPLINKLKLNEPINIEKLNIDKQLLDKINKFAPINHILKDKSKNDKRKDIRTKAFEETKLLNFYNIGGIRFNNIATNDAMVKSKLNEMTANGWELAFVTGGVESSGDKDPNGIYLTRYIFKKPL